jgi:hypothetical protein
MNLPFFSFLADSRTVLIAGAGGGFDVFAGLPLFHWLRAHGKTVHLANLSFSDLSRSRAHMPVPEIAQITAQTSWATYFLELHLAGWLKEQGHPDPVYAIIRSGAAPVRRAYEWLVSALRPDTIILVDGGTDILMCGDEAGLGTPQEDMASLAAAADVDGVEQRFVACLGFGIDTYHGVCHAHFLENVSPLIGDGGFLGAWSLLREMPEFQFYEQACRYAHKCMPDRNSIVNSTIMAAVNGWSGDLHPTKRTEGTKVSINPLMAQYWTFDLNTVAARNRYLDRIRPTESYQELSLAIETFRALNKNERPWADLPF